MSLLSLVVFLILKKTSEPSVARILMLRVFSVYRVRRTHRGERGRGDAKWGSPSALGLTSSLAEGDPASDMVEKWMRDGW